MSGYVPNNWKERTVPTPEPYNGDFDKQSPRPLVLNPTPEPKPATEPLKPAGCVFARSCNLPEGVINHSHPGGFVPVEPLSTYGNWAVLGTLPANALGQVPLRLLGGSLTSAALSSSLGGGTLALGAAGATGAAGAGAGAASAGGAMGTGGLITTGVVAGALVGVVAALFPNSAGEDSTLYSPGQLKTLTFGRTRVRMHVQQMPNGEINAYGVYTGLRRDWEMVPVLAAIPRGDNFVADLGNGIELIWTPAVDPRAVIGNNPPLEAAPVIPHVWVYPISDQTEKVLVNPVHPPEYQDLIIWFPQTDIQPLYLVLNVRHEPGVVTGQGEEITGIWLAAAGSGLGAPIPSQIADRLRGRAFGSFDAFREAFWEAVAADATLSNQFITTNRKRMLKGKAPKVREADRAGGRTTYELHHVELVSKGGEVYNVDNLRAVTAKRHIEIHGKGE